MQDYLEKPINKESLLEILTTYIWYIIIIDELN